MLYLFHIFFPRNELGLVFGLPNVDELPPDSQPYYPLVLVESKLGLPFQHYNDLIRETDQVMCEATDPGKIEQASKIMIMLKPDNYTAMNMRYITLGLFFSLIKQN